MRRGKPKSKRQQETSSLTNAVLQVVSAGDYARVWRQNNTAIYDPATKRYRAFQGLRGVADIMGYTLDEGKLVAIEVKAPGDHLSEEQKGFLQGVAFAGGIAIVARSIDQFLLEWEYVTGRLRIGSCVALSSIAGNMKAALKQTQGFTGKVQEVEDDPLGRKVLVDYGDLGRFWVSTRYLKTRPTFLP